jgi:hypothetical protein
MTIGEFTKLASLWVLSVLNRFIAFSLLKVALRPLTRHGSIVYKLLLS